MAPYEALYGKKCRTPLCWGEEGEKKLFGPELIELTTEKVRVIQQRIMRFGKKGKLSPRYIGPYKILERIGAVAYQLELPEELSRLHDVFHVSMLRKYILNPSHVLVMKPIELKENLTYVEEQVQILDHQEQVLRNKFILLVKVLWRSHTVEEATWESEEVMRIQYPHLFGMFHAI
ncbi:uncharacterized protein LOC132277372 [Cornus florida]|uniref:uncharacterized protein LOC132277372 n=1 Tax=Cornus florida TaxID=4283 RepID=UPI00289E6BB4|nr:uncharacterized protein LOC132277372 [Cornus florida]